MRNELITVFGGTGFIGRHLVRRLAAQGARILVVSRNPARGYFLQPMGSVGQIVVERVDLTSEQALAQALAGLQRRGQPHGHPLRDPAAEVRRGPCRDARAHREASPRQPVSAQMVHVSAIGADPDSSSAYARSKAEGERRVREALPAPRSCGPAS